MLRVISPVLHSTKSGKSGMEVPVAGIKRLKPERQAIIDRT
jgi:hypothetical protein